ncbi:MAG: hypothetical protein IJM59_13460 [Proteobacteria bacterium]|nr:hypothetical protein [Pseudomonadota bacterium]
MKMAFTKVENESEMKAASGICQKRFRTSLSCLLACAALSLVSACGDDGGDGGDDACAGVTCSDHGTCEVKDGAAVCSCETGYHVKENEATTCEADEPGEVKPVTCDGIDCGGHGTCEVKDGAAVCRCDDGYHVKENDAKSCEADDPGDVKTACDGVDCSGHGTCEVKEGAAVCVCDDGYHVKEGDATTCESDELGDIKTVCDDVDCSGHGTCEVKEGAAVCVCDDGYHVKENEATICESDEPGDVKTVCDGIDCDGHGTCEVKEDAAICSCEDGYQVKADDLKHCEAIKSDDVVVIKFIEVGDSKTQADIEKKLTLNKANYSTASIRDFIKDGNDKDVYKSFFINIGTKEEYFEIGVNDLNIDPNEYEDLRVDIDYLVPTVSTNLVSTYGLEVYNNVLGDNHPYYLEDYYPNGYYVYKTAGFYRGYNLVTENLITEDLKKSKKKIESIKIVPYGNLPLTTDESETYKGAWRKQITSFVVKSIKVVGYKKGKYKNPYTTSKTTSPDELRLNSALRMYDTATMRWIPDIDLTAVRNIGGVHFADGVLYRKGEVNYGAPYTQRNRVTIEKYVSELDDKGVITAIKDAENKQSMDYYGQDCALSVYYSLAKYIPYEATQGVMDLIWNRSASSLLGGLKIKGEKESTLSVYQELNEEDYNKKEKNNKLSKVPESVMNRAVLESNARIKSNDSKIKYIKIRPAGEIYDYLLYLPGGVPKDNHLSLLLNNLGISSSNNTVKITYNKYTTDTDINPSFEINGEKVNSVRKSSILIKSYYDSTYNCTVSVYENEYRLTTPSDKKIDSIKIYPFGANSSATFKAGFRLTSLVIKEADGGNAIDISASKYMMYYDLNKFIANNEIKDEFVTAFNSDKELFDNALFKSEKEMYGTEKDMIVAKFLAGQALSKAYSELKIGDVVATNSNPGGIHIRMITGNTHVECMDGEVLTVAGDKMDAPKGSCDTHGGIDLNKSYYIRTDISSNTSKTDDDNKNNYGGLVTNNEYVASREWHPNSELTDLTKLSDLKDKNLNFYIDTKNSFAQALATAYLPITLNVYKNGEIEEPMVLLFDKNTLDDIRSGFKGTLYSNYTIISIHFDIKDRGNAKEYSFDIYPSRAPNYKNKDNDYSNASFNKEGMFGNYYSLYYNLPDDNAEINKLLAKGKLSDDFEIIVSVTAGTGEKMEALHLDSKKK